MRGFIADMSEKLQGLFHTQSEQAQKGLKMVSVGMCTVVEMYGLEATINVMC